MEPIVHQSGGKICHCAPLGAALQLVPAPDVIRSHPLFRALCGGANASVVGWPVDIVTGYTAHCHFNQYTCTGHRSCLHPCTTCAPFLRIVHMLRSPKKSTRRIAMKLHRRVRSGHITLVESESEYGISNFSTVYQPSFTHDRHIQVLIL